MNEIKKFLLPAAAMFIFSGCTEEFLSDTEVMGNTTIVGRMAEKSQTRTCIGSDGTSDVSIYWSPADSIGVYGERSKNVLFVNRNTVASAEGQFVGYLSSSAPLYAYYPYSKENAGADYTSLKGNLPLVRYFDMSTGSLQGDYKVGVPQNSQSEDGAYVFDFEHLFSLLEFEINATGTALEGDRLERITLTLPDGRQAGGEFTFDASTKNVVWGTAPANANVMDMVWTDKPALTNGSQQNKCILSMRIWFGFTAHSAKHTESTCSLCHICIGGSFKRCSSDSQTIQKSNSAFCIGTQTSGILKIRTSARE